MICALCWQGESGHSKSCEIWKSISLCLSWMIWRERNIQTYEGIELSLISLKSLFLFFSFFFFKKVEFLLLKYCVQVRPKVREGEMGFLITQLTKKGKKPVYKKKFHIPQRDYVVPIPVNKARARYTKSKPILGKKPAYISIVKALLDVCVMQFSLCLSFFFFG